MQTNKSTQIHIRIRYFAAIVLAPTDDDILKALFINHHKRK